MKSNPTNLHTSKNSRKWSWKLYFSFLAIGIGVIILSFTGFSKIVLIFTFIVGILSAIYFAVLGVAGIVTFVFIPQSELFFGWDRLVSISLGTFTGQMAVMAYFGKRIFSGNSPKAD